MLSRCGAVRAGAQKRDRAILDKVLNSSDTTTTAVFAEDGTPLVGIVLAFASFLAYQLSGSAAPVTLGSIAMGLLLGVIVVVLIQKTRRIMVRQAGTAELRGSVARQLIESTKMARIIYLRLKFVGPRKLYLVAAVDLAGGRVGSEVASRLRSLERRIESHDSVAEAVQTLATADESSLVF